MTITITGAPQVQLTSSGSGTKISFQPLIGSGTPYQYSAVSVTEQSLFFYQILAGLAQGVAFVDCLSLTSLTLTNPYISPTTGTHLGGTTVSLFGTGLRPTGIVTLDGLRCQVQSYSDNTQLQFITPAHVAGAVNLVYIDERNSSVTQINVFTYT